MSKSIGASPLEGYFVPDTLRTFKLTKDFQVVTKGGDVIIVKTGFETDFASVPRLFWRLFPPIHNYKESAVVHDWLYNRAVLKRNEADKIFLELMERQGVNWVSRHTIYRAVRMFGGGHYGSKKKGGK